MLNAMMTALTNLFKPLHTLNYPAEPITHPENYRGLIEYGLEHCIFCDKCEKVCPPGAILFSHHLDGTKTYSHGGNIPDFSAFMALVPEQKRGAVMLFNADPYGLPESRDPF